jgi:ABC-2 type transport system ATP-binding protein
MSEAGKPRPSGQGAVTRLTLENVSLDFPVYQSSSRSIRKIGLRTGVGGRISIGSSAVPVVQALRDVNLDLKPGDRLGIVGHNGAGKTTLLRVLAGIYHPLVGSVHCEGKRMPLTDIQVGYDDEATGYEMILLRGLLMGLTRAEIEARVAEIAQFSELGEFLDLPIRTYSSGMILRLFFSIATSIHADILLMDEWIAAGDEAFLKKANERLQSVVDRAHILVIASHSRDLLSRLCTRGLLLDAGRVACDGSLEDAFRAYDRLQHAA